MEILNIENYYFALILIVAGAIRYALWTKFYKKRVEQIKAQDPNYKPLLYSPQKAKSLLVVGIVAFFGSALYAHFILQPKKDRQKEERHYQEQFQNQKALEPAP